MQVAMLNMYKMERGRKERRETSKVAPGLLLICCICISHFPLYRIVFVKDLAVVPVEAGDSRL